MSNIPEQVAEDIEAAVMGGRLVRQHGPWSILVGDSDLKFHPATIGDPLPTGAQVISIAGVTEPVEHIVFRMLDTGLLEEIRPDETTDIRSGNVARFLVFRTDRTFRFLLEDRAFDWGASHISGGTLKSLAGYGDTDVEVWQDVRGGSDLRIGPHDLVDLAAAGVERFYFLKPGFKLVVNAQQKIVDHRKVEFWEIVRLAFLDAVPSETTVYSIDYGKGPTENPQGSLVAGQHVFVKDGMTFYVTQTDKS